MIKININGKEVELPFDLDEIFSKVVKEAPKQKPVIPQRRLIDPQRTRIPFPFGEMLQNIPAQPQVTKKSYGMPRC